MQVTVSGCAPTARGLHIGLVIHGPKDAWIRFASVSLDVPNLDVECRKALSHALSIGLPGVIGDGEEWTLELDDLE